MKHLKKFNESTEPTKAEGEYTTEDFDAFMREMLDTVEWSGEDVARWKRTTFTMPSARDRNASSVSNTKEEATQNWEEALKARGGDKNITWYVWVADVGGSFNKPKKFGPQRFDIQSILDIVRKYPDAVRKLSVSINSEEHSKFGDMMQRDYYNGKPGNYTGD